MAGVMVRPARQFDQQAQLDGHASRDRDEHHGMTRQVRKYRVSGEQRH